MSTEIDHGESTAAGGYQWLLRHLNSVLCDKVAAPRLIETAIATRQAAGDDDEAAAAAAAAVPRRCVADDASLAVADPQARPCVGRQRAPAEQIGALVRASLRETMKEAAAAAAVRDDKERARSAAKRKAPSGSAEAQDACHETRAKRRRAPAPPERKNFRICNVNLAAKVRHVVRIDAFPASDVKRHMQVLMRGSGRANDDDDDGARNVHAMLEQYVDSETSGARDGQVPSLAAMQAKLEAHADARLRRCARVVFILRDYLAALRDEKGRVRTETLCAHLDLYTRHERAVRLAKRHIEERLASERTVPLDACIEYLESGRESSSSSSTTAAAPRHTEGVRHTFDDVAAALRVVRQKRDESTHTHMATLRDRLVAWCSAGGGGDGNGNGSTEGARVARTGGRVYMDKSNCALMVCMPELSCKVMMYAALSVHAKGARHPSAAREAVARFVRLINEAVPDDAFYVTEQRVCTAMARAHVGHAIDLPAYVRHFAAVAHHRAYFEPEIATSASHSFAIEPAGDGRRRPVYATVNIFSSGKLWITRVRSARHVEMAFDAVCRNAARFKRSPPPLRAVTSC